MVCLIVVPIFMCSPTLVILQLSGFSLPSLVPSTVFPCRVLSSCWQENVDQGVAQGTQDLEVLGDATGVVHGEVLCSPVYSDAP